MWAVPFGKGRVVHIHPGARHCPPWHQPGFAAALARGTEWAATGAVTLPARIAAAPEPRKDAMRVLVVTGGHGYPAAFYTPVRGLRRHPLVPRRHAAAGLQRQARASYDVVVLHDHVQRHRRGRAQATCGPSSNPARAWCPSITPSWTTPHGPGGGRRSSAASTSSSRWAITAKSAYKEDVEFIGRTGQRRGQASGDGRGAAPARATTKSTRACGTRRRSRC